MSRGRWLVRVLGLVLLLTLFPAPALPSPIPTAWPTGEGVAAAAPQVPNRPTHVPGELIVKFEPGADRGAILGAHANLGVKEKRRLLLDDYSLVSFPTEKNIDRVAEALRRHPAVERVERNGYRYVDAVQVNDPRYGEQWNLPLIQVPEAWQVSNGSGVIVAVVDTGVAYKTNGQIRDFEDSQFVDGYDFVNDDPYPFDDYGHGTHVAGTIAQRTNNGYGVAGVAYGAKIMPIKVLDAAGYGDDADVADGIKWAVDRGARVINLSLGGSEPAWILEEAANYAVARGTVVVAASGNYQGTGDTWSVSYPAAYASVIAVGAVGRPLDGNPPARSSYSKYGPQLDLVAPGGDGSYGILQEAFPVGNPAALGFYYMKGTSMATPHVSAVAAMLIASGKTGPFRVREALEATARDLGATDRDDEYGHGLIQAADALAFQSSVVPRVWLPFVTRN